MIAVKFFSHKFIIGFGAMILVTYLVLLLSITHFGHNKLKQSQADVLELKVNQYVNTLEFILSAAKHYGNDLQDDKAVQTFFSNLHSGMSMEYGLGSSLLSLQRWMDTFVLNSQINKNQVFKRIVLLDYSHKILADTHKDVFFDISPVSFAEPVNSSPQILVVDEEDGVKIQLHQVILQQGKSIGVFVADLNMSLITNQLSLQEDVNNGSRLILDTKAGKSLLIWNTLSPELYGETGGNTIYFRKPIQGINLFLVSWFEPNDDDLLTSPSFVLAISILSVPVIFGLFYLIRLDKSNTILKTQVEASTKEQNTLSLQNELLASEITKRKTSEKLLAFQASHDELTGLANRSVGHNFLSKSIKQATSGTEILVMFIDLDDFKEINDTFGHAAGDDIIKMTSRRLIEAVSETDLVARFGGDEFLLIVEAPKDSSETTVLAMKLLELFNAPFYINGHDFFTTTSIGISMYPKDGRDAETLLKNADMALYRAKDSGKNDFSFYDSSLNKALQRSLILDNRLRLAISNNDIEMHYQPILELSSGKIVAAEALMRWRDEELGFVSPEEFIPLAEKNGLIHRLGEIALKQACENAKSWQPIAAIEVAVNFSTVQFRYCEDLFGKITTILNDTQLPPQRLTIEITESLLVDNNRGLYEMLNKVEALGIELSIDDFGTGYSALSYLQQFPFSKLKIDKAFIDHLQSNISDRSLVQAILAMSRALNLKVIAEGIEDSYQADYLTKLKCEYGQGYYFSKPVTAAEFKKLLINGEAHPSMESEYIGQNI